MPNQKVENMLNLALDATEEEREQSLNLDVGYESTENEWEIIVKYSGDLEAVRELVVSITPLRNGYAIVKLTEENISRLASLPQIEYIEKPKRLYFEVMNGRRVSCINEVQNTRFLRSIQQNVPATRSVGLPAPLFGKGVLVAILDSGIDYENNDFRNMDGTTRILRLWDQTIDGNPPNGYAIGTEYTREQIDEAVQTGNRQLVPSRDASGHGTAVAGVAAGNGRNSDGVYRGVASESDLVIVKLGNPRVDGFPRTTELMQALNYAIDVAVRENKPLAVNISIGNTYGSHDGTSLLERFIDDVSNYGKTVICIGSGNEGTTAGHVSGRLAEGETAEIQLAVQDREPTLNLQIWKSYVDEVDISLIAPDGMRVGPIQQLLGPQRFSLGQTDILLYYGEPSPYSVKQEIYIEYLPRETYIDAGIWKIELIPRRIVEGTYEMWLPSQSALNVGTAFLNPSSELTLTIPSTASRAITVGAYDARLLSYANFSGRGERLNKPDLVAPGVDIRTVGVNNTYVEVSGTSFATPFVTGGAALLMEWGIVNRNDPYLYGEKAKAYLRKGAKALPGFSEYPNDEVGYGALCVRQSIP